LELPSNTEALTYLKKKKLFSEYFSYFVRKVDGLLHTLAVLTVGKERNITSPARN
jgi:hypothetical protein